MRVRAGMRTAYACGGGSRVAISKAKQADRLARAERRREAEEEVIAARIRYGIGFGVTMVVTQALPRVVPAIAEYQTWIDAGLALGGGFFAVTDPSEFGDYMTGVASVGATQTFDNVANAIADFFNAA